MASMLLCLVRGGGGWVLVLRGLGAGLGLLGADRTGLGRWGRLLSGHAQQGWVRGRRRLDGRAHPGGWPVVPGVRPSPGSGLAGCEVAVGLAGDIALEAADDLGFGAAFGGAAGDVGAGGRVA